MVIQDNNCAAMVLMPAVIVVCFCCQSSVASRTMSAAAPGEREMEWIDDFCSVFAAHVHPEVHETPPRFCHSTASSSTEWQGPWFHSPLHSLVP